MLKMHANIACLTIVLTGTTSLMTQTTSHWTRIYACLQAQKKSQPEWSASKYADFVDETGDASEEYVAFHQGAENMDGNKRLRPRHKRYTQEEIDELQKITLL